MTGLMPPGPLSYEGQVTIPYINRPFPPTSSFSNFTVPTVWVDTLNKDAYILVGLAGSATWIPVSGLTVVVSPTNGGTGVSNPTAHTIPIAEGSSDFNFLGPLLSGQLLIGAAGADPIPAYLTSTGGTINISNAAGSINLESNNSGMNWTVVTASQTAGDNQGYLCNAGGVIQIVLPSTSLVGDTFEVVAMSAGGWSISQPVNTQVSISGISSTTGVGGSVSSTARGDWIQLTCSVANTNWIACSKEGVFTII